TEYKTGIHARIGYPNEHLASGYIDELAMPMYATCIGLILKGYNDYENKVEQEERIEELNRKREKKQEQKQELEEAASFLPTIEKEEKKAEEATFEAEEKKEKPSFFGAVNPGPRKTIKDFMNSMKEGLIDLFREEDDAQF